MYIITFNPNFGKTHHAIVCKSNRADTCYNKGLFDDVLEKIPCRSNKLNDSECIIIFQIDNLLQHVIYVMRLAQIRNLISELYFCLEVPMPKRQCINVLGTCVSYKCNLSTTSISVFFRLLQKKCGNWQTFLAFII